MTFTGVCTVIGQVVVVLFILAVYFAIFCFGYGFGYGLSG